jgi:hypothetical protein
MDKVEIKIKKPLYIGKTLKYGESTTIDHKKLKTLIEKDDSQGKIDD